MSQLVDTTQKINETFSYNDIARGISDVVFYGGAWRNESNVSGMVLTNSSFWSNPIVLKYLMSDPAGIPIATKLMTKNFDLDFGAPRIINGTMVINVPMGISLDFPCRGTGTIIPEAEFFQIMWLPFWRETINPCFLKIFINFSALIGFII